MKLIGSIVWLSFVLAFLGCASSEPAEGSATQSSESALRGAETFVVDTGDGVELAGGALSGGSGTVAKKKACTCASYPKEHYDCNSCYVFNNQCWCVYGLKSAGGSNDD